ncbi:hypothetical protein ACO2KH_18460 [Leptospira terpstrae]|uniref:hypothetical protein n=1 Tax=Leptospira terpstrae TaxID=293075 RepID=UPI003D029B06
MSIETIILYQKLNIKKEINKKTKIYLDTNYWKNIAEAKASSQNKFSKLYNLLSEKVTSGKIICPVSNVNFIETLKQNHNSRLRVASVFDELSNLVAIDLNQILLLEDILLIHSLNSGESVSNLEKIPIWTFAAFIFGEIDISLPNLNQSGSEKLKHALVNKIKEQSFTEIFNTLSNSPAKETFFRELAKDENEISEKLKEYSKTINKKPSWSQIYSFALTGNLLKSKERIIKLIEELKLPEPNIQFEKILKKTMNVKKLDQYIPSRKIISGIHAIYSHDSARIYDPNDFEDSLHSCLALPYYDIFFTDKSNAKILTSDLLSFDKIYNCKIEYNLEKCIEIIESI